MSLHDAEKRLALEIRSRKLQVRSMQRTNHDPDAILVVMAEIEELIEKYNHLSDTVYIEKIDDIANDFCDEFYYELGKNSRDELLISKFYDLDAVLTVVGNDKYTGKLSIVKSILVGHCPHVVLVECYINDFTGGMYYRYRTSSRICV